MDVLFHVPGDYGGSINPGSDAYNSQIIQNSIMMVCLLTQVEEAPDLLPLGSLAAGERERVDELSSIKCPESRFRIGHVYPLVINTGGAFGANLASWQLRIPWSQKPLEGLLVI